MASGTTSNPPRRVPDNMRATPRPSDIRGEFGRAMQRSRRARGLSQEDVAAITDIDRAYVGRLERGEANPTLLMLAGCR
jgi:ribosome-binding protein aMBF1 (putative translation factor)